MNCKVAAIHRSTLFSLMFGRQFNSFQNYEQVQVGLLSYKDLKNRMDYLTRIIFPGISAKVNTMQKKIVNIFNKKIHIEDILFSDRSYIMITNVTRRSKLDLIYESPYKIIQ